VSAAFEPLVRDSRKRVIRQLFVLISDGR